MLFWTIAGALAALAAWAVARPMLGAAASGAAAPDLAIYKGQLAEVDRDVARGLLPAEEALRARTEIARRLLAADRAGPRPLREAPRAATLAGVGAGAVLLVMGSLGLYAALGAPGARDLPRSARLEAAEARREARPAQAEAEALAPPMAAPDVPAEDLALVEELRRLVPTRPDDLRGWELLALHEARLGRWADAARAQARVLALKGDAATVADHLGLVDRMVAAAGGLVTPEAEAALGPAARLDPQAAGVRYYLGLVEAQSGRPDLAVPLWRAVVERTGPDSFHRRLALAQLPEAARRAGVEWEPPPGPSAEDAAAAEAMDPTARDDMIRGMVEGLRGRLTAEGGTVEEWARLVDSLAVLGDAEGSRAALAQARAALGAEAAALDAALQGLSRARLQGAAP